ncbi:hypothetical protein ATHL_00865 [Anaerolinea thermolimosa]|uniref:hypothetical protein n=1 Tax=Anaerolinea thermolimosa TaxID=229919 RepID=UPI000782C84B|nr:hypothetical protein [Anaerolinea thermolimosa]GAP06019.1 hypothetical protein ATHL_00865 [Anaerolinea thermolimosa]
MIVAQIILEEQDVQRILASHRFRPKDWKGFLKFLSENLGDALGDAVWNQVRDLAELYRLREDCPHEHTTLSASGEMHYTPGWGPWDDLREEVICLDCGKALTDQELERLKARRLSA